LFVDKVGLAKLTNRKILLD